MPYSTPDLLGISTLVWGADGVMDAPAGAIIESVSITPKNAGPVADIENGDGASVTLVTLKDGFSARVTCVYDTAKTWPDEGDWVVLTLPKVGAAGGEQTYDCVVTSIVSDLAKKREAKITIAMEHRPGIAKPA